VLDDVEMLLSPTITTSSIVDGVEALLPTISAVVASMLVLDDVELLLSPTMTTSSIVDGVKALLPTGITSVFLESFLHCAIASSLFRSVLLAANPGSPNPAGGSRAGTRKQQSAAYVMKVYNCGLPVPLCSHAHLCCCV
jgi:hypothetical protein